METRYVKANTHEKCWHNIDGIRKKAQSEFICFLLKIHSMCLIFPFSIVHSDDDETFHVSKTTRREILCANKAAPNGRLKKAPSKRKRETLSTHLTGEQPFDTTYLTPLIVVAERRTNCRHPASWMDGCGETCQLSTGSTRRLSDRESFWLGAFEDQAKKAKPQLMNIQQRAALWQ